MTEEKLILDMTCGGRSIWFNKEHPNCIYFDRRDEEYEQTFGTDPSERHIKVHPDVLGDFRDLPFEDNTFSLVVFDPPTSLAKKGITDGLRRHTDITHLDKRHCKVFRLDSGKA